MLPNLCIRDIRNDEFEALGQLMVDTYSKLAGFPTPNEQPDYYHMLANIGKFTEKKDTRVLVAVLPDQELAGGVVYFADMAEYGSGGIAPTIKNASGIRLLGVTPKCKSMGVGKALTNACIRMAKEKGHHEVILHTTQAMQIAWGLYRKLGFERSAELDFMQAGLPVFGFQLKLLNTT